MTYVEWYTLQPCTSKKSIFYKLLASDLFGTQTKGLPGNVINLHQFTSMNSGEQ